MSDSDQNEHDPQEVNQTQEENLVQKTISNAKEDFLSEFSFEGLIQRVSSVLFQKKGFWEEIKAEDTDIKGLYYRYALVLALIPAICSFIGQVFIGVSLYGVTYRQSFFSGLVQTFVDYLVALIILYVAGFLIETLTPRFQGNTNRLDGVKLTLAAMIPSYVAGILLVVPFLLANCYWMNVCHGGFLNFKSLHG